MPRVLKITLTPLRDFQLGVSGINCLIGTLTHWHINTLAH